jgi:hypothetical protein
MMEKTLEVHNKANVSDEMMVNILTKALELLSVEEQSRINKVIIAPSKKGPMVNFVLAL